MPELPDLQVFSRNLQKLFKGKTLEKLTIENGKHLKITAAAFNKALAGNKLEDIYREGKQLRFRFSNGNILGMHLMLHGKLVLFEKKNEEKNSIASLLFDDGKGLALTDYQGMAQLTLNPEESDAPDALSKEMNAAFMKEKFAGMHKKVKDVLLDQHFIRGIGNAYADEILWHARISPFSYTDKIPAAKVTELATTIKEVLKDAEKQIIKSNPGIIAGEMRDFLVIHNSRLKESPKGKPIEQKAVKGRKTYYTEEQELYE
jgi:formamidopyrimidine-DNA glycosylase